MARVRTSIANLRREIDGIDDAIHDLLMKRAEIVEEIGQAKSRGGNAPFFRPAREAEIVRRLVKRTKGRLPAYAVARVWREMVSAYSAIQGPFNVVVHAPEKSVGYWDLARDHYGACTKMSLHRQANRVISQVFDESTTVGVLELPQDDDTNPWWRHLLSDGEHMPRVVAKLPFIDDSRGRFENLGALAIAQAAQEKTGDDVSLIAVEVDANLSRAKLTDGLVASGLPANIIAVWQDPASRASRVCLVEIADFVAPKNSRLERFKKGMEAEISRLVPLGGYAVPLGQVDNK